MPLPIRVHFDNSPGFAAPHLHAWFDGTPATLDVAPAGRDAFGPYFDVTATRSLVRFKFKEGPGVAGPWEDDRRARRVWPASVPPGPRDEIWCRGDSAFVYHVRPKAPAGDAAAAIAALSFAPGVYVPATGSPTGLGALPLAGGGVLFGLYQPNAARVFVAGDFNGWQCPGLPQPNPAAFVELDLHRGWFGVPNTWLKVVPNAAPGQEYKFWVEGGVPTNGSGRACAWSTDPFARRLGPSFDHNNAMIVDPAAFRWHDAGWRTPDPAEVILYELSVFGFTESDGGIPAADQGRFAGVTDRIRSGYFQQLGVTALSLMPLAEVPSMQSGTALGYNPSLFTAVERDFGTPDDLRTLVDEAHQRGLAVLLDQVFNHTDNSFNPLWQAILEHPTEEERGEGGLYFSGSTRWGNRVATEKTDVQNLLIDACKLWLREYHVDGFRFDATHTDWMDHGFLLRLATELKAFKPDVLLVAENLPNQRDLDRAGYDGYAQWCDPFHDAVKPLLAEREVDGTPNTSDRLGDVFYFSKSAFAAHTNNVVNYCESHDEHSVPHEVGATPWLSHRAAKDRKARLGLFGTAVALGQPMLYMGQEFNVDRPRNVVSVEWPQSAPADPTFAWASRLLQLRRRYPGLRLRGYDPAADGTFAWVLGPWMDAAHGGGRRVIGWRARPNAFAHDALVVLLNFEGFDVQVDVELGIAGTWLKLADIERVNDVPPAGTSSAADPAALRSGDGRFCGFTLPSTSAFLYKWDAP
jgi:1,4-alpha-glucan branching enzyme